jgi:hypothetical protein
MHREALPLLEAQARFGARAANFGQKGVGSKLRPARLVQVSLRRQR